MLLIILAMFIFFIWLISQRMKRAIEKPFGVYVWIILGLTLIPWLFLRYFVAVSDQRHVLTIGLHQIKARIIGSSKRENLILSQIEGYLISDYPMRFWTFKCLGLYFKTGERWELPQFLYWNFGDIGPMLEEAGIDYLGSEKYRFRWWPL